MGYKFYKIEIIFSLLCFMLFSGCEVDRHDYRYVVQHSANATGGILLAYSLNGETEVRNKWLEPDESFRIYERKGVSGDGIWNIETSSALYAIPKIVAINRDASKMTEELSQRHYWPSHPEDRDGNGVYTLRITDDMFILERQEFYVYYIYNAMEDSLFVTSSLLGNPARRRDTIIVGQTCRIGEAEIYTYNEDHRDTGKYIEKKLSGISSLTIKYRGNLKNINFINHKLLNLQIDREQCTLTVDHTIFE